jgi:hypothetical protein
MGKYYIITNWRGGYDTAERKITDKLIDTKESPFFIVEAYE